MTLQKKTKEPPYPPFLKRYTPFLWFLWLQRERKKKQNRRGQWGKMLWLWLSTDRKGKPGGVPPILMVQIYQRIDEDWTILTTTSQRSNKSFINENKSMRKDGKRLWIDGARTIKWPPSLGLYKHRPLFTSLGGDCRRWSRHHTNMQQRHGTGAVFCGIKENLIPLIHSKFYPIS